MRQLIKMDKILVDGMDKDVDVRFNITLGVLEDAIKFAMDNKINCLSMAIKFTDIGSLFYVGVNHDSEHMDITDVEDW